MSVELRESLMAALSPVMPNQELALRAAEILVQVIRANQAEALRHAASLGDENGGQVSADTLRLMASEIS